MSRYDISASGLVTIAKKKDQHEANPSSQSRFNEPIAKQIRTVLFDGRFNGVDADHHRLLFGNVSPKQLERSSLP